MKKLLFALSAILMITLASCGGKSNDNVNIDDYVGKYKVTEVGGQAPKESIGEDVVVAKNGEDIDVAIGGQAVTLKKQDDGTYNFTKGDFTTTVKFEETSDGKMLKLENSKKWELTAKKVD